MAHSTPQLLVICSPDVMHRSTVRSPSFWPQTLFLAAAGNLKPIKSSPSSGVSCAEVLGELGLFDGRGLRTTLGPLDLGEQLVRAPYQRGFTATKARLVGGLPASFSQQTFLPYRHSDWIYAPGLTPSNAANMLRMKRWCCLYPGVAARAEFSWGTEGRSIG